MRRNNNKDLKKLRTLRLTDKVWEDFLSLKNREDKSWDLFLSELILHIKYIKEL